MIRQVTRIDSKRRPAHNHRTKQFDAPTYQTLEYKSRLNFYVTPPTADITLEQFEQWAIDRLRGNKDLTELGTIANISQFLPNSKHAPSETKRPQKQQPT